ncbi:MAG: DUF4169 family protein [Paracoccaceae bacterium]|nr:DUF4169 family protein [Paracoccaceae bacterium]MDG2259225.1 DUF4169 family protein [Paracoccaceae bacterium]
MADNIVNLNKARKAKVARDKTKIAAENSIKFGRSKSEKQQDRANNSHADRFLDEHKREE